MKNSAAAVFASLALAAAVVAQTPPPPAAQPPPPSESAQFDFWLGEWEVVGKAGKIVGHSRIEKIAAGWGILENWESPGFSGKSINAWNPAKRCWQQFWVGADGSILELAGGLDAAGHMVLRGESPNPKGGTLLNRITYTPNADRTVRQHWEISSDSGATWASAFDGLYRRVGSAS